MICGNVSDAEALAGLSYLSVEGTVRVAKEPGAFPGNLRDSHIMNAIEYQL